MFFTNAEEIIDEPIRDKIQLINPVDCQKLEDFFRSLFLEGDFTFTLFGNKPMGSIDLLVNSLDKQATINYTGWQVWKKYQYLFPLSNFEIVYYDNTYNHLFFGFLIVNKKKCREIVYQHFSLFKSCFCFETIDDFIDKLCSPIFFSSYLTNRPENFHLCLGLLFGYGEKSSRLFERRMQLFQEIAKYPYYLSTLNDNDKESLYFLDKTKITQQKCVTSVNNLIEELNELQKLKKFACLTKINNPLYLIKLNGFVTFADDPELEILQAKNDELREKLMEINYSKNFLELILIKLTSEHP